MGKGVPVVKFYNNTPYQLEVRESRIENSGLGIYSLQWIPCGSFIGYYEGFWQHNPKEATNYSYYINSKTMIDIDPLNKPYTSMFNDAFRTEYRNNVASQVLLEPEIVNIIRKRNSHKWDSNRAVGLYTTADIYPGDEMYFEYGDFYWKGW